MCSIHALDCFDVFVFVNIYSHNDFLSHSSAREVEHIPDKFTNVSAVLLFSCTHRTCMEGQYKRVDIKLSVVLPCDSVLPRKDSSYNSHTKNLERDMYFTPVAGSTF